MCRLLLSTAYPPTAPTLLTPPTTIITKILFNNLYLHCEEVRERCCSITLIERNISGNISLFVTPLIVRSILSAVIGYL